MYRLWNRLPVRYRRRLRLGLAIFGYAGLTLLIWAGWTLTVIEMPHLNQRLPCDL